MKITGMYDKKLLHTLIDSASTKIPVQIGANPSFISCRGR